MCYKNLLKKKGVFCTVFVPYCTKSPIIQYKLLSVSVNNARLVIEHNATSSLKVNDLIPDAASRIAAVSIGVVSVDTVVVVVQ